MKKLIFSVAFLVIATVANAQETTLSFDLKGKVKFVEESSYKYVEKFGEVEVGDFLGRNYKVFNDKGYLIKKYEIRGGRNSRDTVGINDYVYLNNERGQIKEINNYYQLDFMPKTKNLNSKTKLKYDETSNLVQKIVYSGAGSFIEGFRYTYEKEKRVSENIDSEGNIIKPIYDPIYQVQLLEQSSFVLIDGVEVGNEVAGYRDDVIDSLGNWTKRIEFRGKKQFKGHERRIIYFN